MRARHFTKGFNEDVEHWVCFDSDNMSVSMRFESRGRALQMVATVNQEKVHDEFAGKVYEPTPGRSNPAPSDRK